MKSVQIVEREKLGAVLDELKLQRSKLFDAATAVKIGKLAGAEYLLTGAYEMAGDQMRIDARIIEVATANITAVTKVSGKKDEFFELEKELCDLLTGKLGVPLDTSDKARLRKVQTESFEAFRLYARGLDAVDRGDKAAALSDFQKALEADPKYKAARGALERLNAALETHGKVRAEGFAGLMTTLDPSSPTFYDDVDDLPKKFGGTNHERDHNAMLVLAWLAEKGYRPWKSDRSGQDFLDNERRYFELHETLGELASYGYRLGALDEAVVALEYLHDKYPDESSVWVVFREHSAHAREALAERAQGKLKDAGGSREMKERDGWRADLLRSIARVRRAAPGRKSAEPAAILDRLDAALDDERRRGHAAFDKEFRRRLAALDPKDEKVGFPLGELAAAARDHFERYGQKADAFPYQLLTLEWAFDRRVRPYHGTREHPFFTEEHELLQLVNHYANDAATAPLLPPVAEYVLAKYSDDPMVGSQVRLTKEHIEGCRGEDAGSCRRNWERESTSGEHIHADKARALFRKIGKTGYKPAR